MTRKVRLTSPLVRRDGRLVEASWDEALTVAASGFKRIRDEHGGSGDVTFVKRD